MSDQEVGSHASTRLLVEAVMKLFGAQMDVDDDDYDRLTPTSTAASTNTLAMVGMCVVTAPPSLTVGVRVFTGYERISNRTVHVRCFRGLCNLSNDTTE